MDKGIIYNNIFEMINDGFFLNKYVEMTKDIVLDNPNDENNVKQLENISAGIFNSILIGCQLFDDRGQIEKFVDMFSTSLNTDSLNFFLESEFGIDKNTALERLKHGFGVHFTTVKICNEIKNSGKLAGFGTNAMFTKEEDEIINEAVLEQKSNNPHAEENLNYLFRGWGTGVSSYSSMTNGFWMYHTPESLSFLFGNISTRNKDRAMKFVLENISALGDDTKRKTFEVMSNIYDRLIGEEQEVGCILIDRDSLTYEVDYYYETIAVERRPYSKNFNDLMSNDNKITNDIDVNQLHFLTIPTVVELERQKQEIISNDTCK